VQSDDFWAFAGEHCTDRELSALRVYFAQQFGDHTHREAADLLGLSKNAYKQRVRRAKRKLYERKQ
jgi:DNA-directed RNA polymerase specialized sigma24 family protein